jgi:hypothetical protein
MKELMARLFLFLTLFTGARDYIYGVRQTFD